MNQKLSRIVPLAAFVTMLSTAAYGFVLLNPPRRWFDADMPRQVHVHSAGMPTVNCADGGVANAIAAVEAWNSSTMTLDAVADTTTYALGDGRSNVAFNDPLNICTGTCLAATTIGYYTTGSAVCCGGTTMYRYTDSDVAFNESYSYTSPCETDGCGSEFWLDTVLTHEIGHLIGLGHSNASSALMYPSVGACQHKGLASDDTSGRDALYACSETPGACGGACTPSGGSCTSNGQCCSGSCKGKPGNKTCR